MANDKPNLIYSRGAMPLIVKGISFDVIERHGWPMLLVGAARQTFKIHADYAAMLDHVVKLLNEAAGT